MQEKLFRKAALEKLSTPEELDQLMQVTTPKGWLALIAIISLLVATIAIGFLGVIAVRVDGRYCIVVKDAIADSAQAFVYISPLKENRVVVGDEVHITPSTFTTGDYILGSVATVDDFPVSDVQMQAIIGNQTLVQQLLEDGPLIQIVVNPVQVAGDSSVYRSASGTIPRDQISDKMTCTASIKVDEKAPINLILRDLN